MAGSVVLAAAALATLLGVAAAIIARVVIRRIIGAAPATAQPAVVVAQIVIERIIEAPAPAQTAVVIAEVVVRRIISATPALAPAFVTALVIAGIVPSRIILAVFRRAQRRADQKRPGGGDERQHRTEFFQVGVLHSEYRTARRGAEADPFPVTVS